MAAAAPPCPAAAVARRPALVAPWLVGDVTGDGQADRVGIARRPGVVCRFFVVVRTDRSSRAWPLRLFDRSPRPSEDRPFLQRLVRIGPGGLKIVVQVRHGASVAFDELFSAERGRLAAIPAPGTVDGLFAGGGAVGTGASGWRCATGGAEAVTARFAPDGSAVLHATRYRLARNRLLRTSPPRRVRGRAWSHVVDVAPFADGCAGTADRKAPG